VEVQKRHVGYKNYTAYQQGGGGSVDPVDILNSGYGYTQFYVPARAMNPGNPNSSVGNVVPTFLEYPIGNREYSLGVYVLAKSNPGKVVTVEFDVIGSEMDVASPEFTVYPVFFQDEDDTVSGLNIELSASITRIGIGETFDVDIDPDPPTASTLTMPVKNRWLNSGGDINDSKNGMLLTPQGSAISATENNTFVLQIERHSDFSSSDTYTKSVLLRGAIIQFKNNFENVSQIPGVNASA
jgi:hypothetical protein